MGNSRVTYLYLRLQKGYRWVTNELLMVPMDKEWRMDDFPSFKIYLDAQCKEITDSALDNEYPLLNFMKGKWRRSCIPNLNYMEAKCCGSIHKTPEDQLIILLA